MTGLNPSRHISEVELFQEIKSAAHQWGDASFVADITEITTRHQRGYLVSISASADCGGGDMPNWTGDQKITQFFEYGIFDSLLAACTLIEFHRNAFTQAVKECAQACKLLMLSEA